MPLLYSRRVSIKLHPLVLRSHFQTGLVCSIGHGHLEVCLRAPKGTPLEISSWPRCAFIAARRWNTNVASAEAIDANEIAALSAGKSLHSRKRIKTDLGRYIDGLSHRFVLSGASHAMEILDIFASLPKGSEALSPQDERIVLDLLKDSKFPPRDTLLEMGRSLRNSPTRRGSTVQPNWGHLLRPIFRMAWNNGMDDGQPKAALLLISRFNKEPDPPEPLVSEAEATAIAKALESQWPHHAVVARAHIAKRKFEEQPEERESLRKSVLESLERAWKADKSREVANMLADLYERGELLPRDMEKCLLWWSRGMKDDIFGHAFGQAVAYSGITDTVAIDMEGENCSMPVRDLTKAREYFEVAARGENRAFYQLGLFYYLDPTSPFRTVEEHSAHWGVEPDDERAARLFTVGAMKFNAQSLCKLSEMVLLKRAEIPGQKESTEADRLEYAAANKHLLAQSYPNSWFGPGPLAQELTVKPNDVDLEEVSRYYRRQLHVVKRKTLRALKETGLSVDPADLTVLVTAASLQAENIWQGTGSKGSYPGKEKEARHGEDAQHAAAAGRRYWTPPKSKDKEKTETSESYAWSLPPPAYTLQASAVTSSAVMDTAEDTREESAVATDGVDLPSTNDVLFTAAGDSAEAAELDSIPKAWPSHSSADAQQNYPGATTDLSSAAMTRPTVVQNSQCMSGSVDGILKDMRDTAEVAASLMADHAEPSADAVEETATSNLDAEGASAATSATSAAGSSAKASDDA